MNGCRMFITLFHIQSNLQSFLKVSRLHKRHKRHQKLQRNERMNPLCLCYDQFDGSITGNTCIFKNFIGAPTFQFFVNHKIPGDCRVQKFLNLFLIFDIINSIFQKLKYKTIRCFFFHNHTLFRRTHQIVVKRSSTDNVPCSLFEIRCGIHDGDRIGWSGSDYLFAGSHGLAQRAATSCADNQIHVRVAHNLCGKSHQAYVKGNYQVIYTADAADRLTDNRCQKL